MCRNHSHATVLKRGQVVLTESGWMTAYSSVGEIKLETPTGDSVILPPTTLFFVPSPGWVGLLVWDIQAMEERTMPERYSASVDVMSQPTLENNTTQG